MTYPRSTEWLDHLVRRSLFEQLPNRAMPKALAMGVTPPSDANKNGNAYAIFNYTSASTVGADGAITGGGLLPATKDAFAIVEILDANSKFPESMLSMSHNPGLLYPGSFIPRIYMEQPAFEVDSNGQPTLATQLFLELPHIVRGIFEAPCQIVLSKAGLRPIVAGVNDYASLAKLAAAGTGADVGRVAGDYTSPNVARPFNEFNPTANGWIGMFSLAQYNRGQAGGV